ncbi:MAG: hypothetical protein N2050_00870 [Flavobacteriales bacterium]|nr:hypothetical protein [Flavobacteriales bacterium]MCX7649089.1 hypothetical protein [Flavobacteriales bacterium]MDW8431605.1 SIS domain-containing protein [Flavobacteriales bacterium]
MTMRQLILGFWDDVRQAFNQPLPENLEKYKTQHFSRLVLCGLGGSGMAGSLIRSLTENFSELNNSNPLWISQCREYDLPACRPEDTLIFLSSHSGNTEETLSCAQQAAEKGIFCVVFTSGGKLQHMALEHNWPWVPLPGGRPPRSCLGFSWVLQMRVMATLGLLHESVLNTLITSIPEWAQRQNIMDDDAREMAFHLKDKCLLIVTDTLLQPVAERWMQQLCENAKTMTHVAIVPEMNHNELVAWRNLPRETHVLFLEHPGLHPRNRLRYTFLQNEINNRLPYSRIVAGENSLIANYAYLIHWGDVLSDHLATVHGVDAMDIQVIDRLKQFLDAHRG